MLTYAEENYLKTIYKIIEKEQKAAATNTIAAYMNTAPASATDMMKKLADKELINYKKYHGVTLTNEGNKIANALIRKHRLWEVFLVNKLRFSWDKVHEIAEELEHINSEELILRLDAFLDYPKYDPHGDPIPNAEGKYTLRSQLPLSNLMTGQSGVLLGVKEGTDDLLKYLSQLKIKLGTEMKIIERVDFDNSLKIVVDGKDSVTISDAVAQSLLVKKV